MVRECEVVLRAIEPTKIFRNVEGHSNVGDGT